MRVLAIADSDSYVKWGAAVLDRMPDAWRTSMVVVATPVTPSDAQLAAAFAGSSFAANTVPVVAPSALAGLIAEHAPDIVLLSLRGEVVRATVRLVVAAAATAQLPRPVLLTGLPGISIPATGKALYYRSQCDYFLLHSKREIADFTQLAASMGVTQSFGLATLPFLSEPQFTASSTALTSGAASTVHSAGTDIIFAAQAKVPREKSDRLRLLGWLAATARAHPGRRVVIKLRAVAGETQTHAEQYPYDVLLRDLDDETLPANLVVASGPMLDHLGQAAGLVTVSSTAAIEAAALGVPILALDDFGTSAQMINLVFEGSNLLASSPALVAAEFRRPNPGWLDDNYFHTEADETWIPALGELVRRRDAGELPLRHQFRGSRGGRLRQIWDRKLAFGIHDTSVSGALVFALGNPLRSMLIASRRGVRFLRPRRR